MNITATQAAAIRAAVMPIRYMISGITRSGETTTIHTTDSLGLVCNANADDVLIELLEPRGECLDGPAACGGWTAETKITPGRCCSEMSR